MERAKKESGTWTVCECERLSGQCECKCKWEQGVGGDDLPMTEESHGRGEHPKLRYTTEERTNPQRKGWAQGTQAQVPAVAQAVPCRLAAASSKTRPVGFENHLKPIRLRDPRNALLAGRPDTDTDADGAQPTLPRQQPATGALLLPPVQDMVETCFAQNRGWTEVGGPLGVGSYYHATPYRAALALSLVLQQGGDMAAVAADGCSCNLTLLTSTNPSGLDPIG